MFLKYSANAELVLIVSTGMAESKKHASCPCPGLCRSTDRTLSTPTVCNILARSVWGVRRRKGAVREEGGRVVGVRCVGERGKREGGREGGEGGGGREMHVGRG